MQYNGLEIVCLKGSPKNLTFFRDVTVTNSILWYGSEESGSEIYGFNSFGKPQYQPAMICPQANNVAVPIITAACSFQQL